MLRGVKAGPLVALAAVVVACSSSSSSPGAAGDGGPVLDFDGGSRLDGGPIHPAAPCEVTIDAPVLQGAAHVKVGDAVAYDSNPPSSGPHYPIWAAYKEWDHSFPRPYYVHDLEHGAVVFLYKCDGACPEIVDTLRKAMAAIPDDADCVGSGVRVRALIVPDPELDVPVAAAAWGWIYRAECADLRTLTDFALNHYAQGPENVCGDGTDQL